MLRPNGDEGESADVSSESYLRVGFAMPGVLDERLDDALCRGAVVKYDLDEAVVRLDLALEFISSCRIAHVLDVADVAGTPVAIGPLLQTVGPPLERRSRPRNEDLLGEGDFLMLLY